MSTGVMQGDVTCPEPRITSKTRKPEGCWRCGGPLGKGRRKWCSDECSEAHIRHHNWTWARDEAIKRVRLPNWDVPCRMCRKPARDPEVNHITPRNGEGYGNGCWNHQDNLEVLCHDCHVKVTMWQGRARKNNGQAHF